VPGYRPQTTRARCPCTPDPAFRASGLECTFQDLDQEIMRKHTRLSTADACMCVCVCVHVCMFVFVCVCVCLFVWVRGWEGGGGGLAGRDLGACEKREPSFKALFASGLHLDIRRCRVTKLVLAVGAADNVVSYPLGPPSPLPPAIKWGADRLLRAT